MKILGILKFSPYIYVPYHRWPTEGILRFLIGLSKKYGIKKYSRYGLGGREFEFKILDLEEMRRSILRLAVAAMEDLGGTIHVHLNEPLADLKIYHDSINVSSVEDPSFEEISHEIEKIRRLWEMGTWREATLTLKAEILRKEGFERTAQMFLNFARKAGFNKVTICTVNPKIKLMNGFESKGRYEKALKIILKKN